MRFLKTLKSQNSNGTGQRRFHCRVHLPRPSSIAYELVISGSFYLYTNRIALLHRIASTAPPHKSQTTFYQRDPIHQTPHKTRVLIILDDKTRRWLNTIASASYPGNTT